MIPREFIEEVKYRNDIVDVIGSYVTLKRAGSNYNGLCPFHSEKTPSFTVFPATSSFYCFGCGAGGEVITFVEKAENLDYPEAIEFLAKRVGLTVPQDTVVVRENEVSRKRVLEMNLEAAKYFRACLFDKDKGAAGMAYLAGTRALSIATIKHFGLGFAPDDFTGLVNHLSSRGFTEEEMVQGYMAGRSARTHKLYSLFRNRVMFPIIDTTGNVVAFGGRVMDDSKPKYLNTSDTPGFKKSRHLFALNYAKNNEETPEYMILCEGYMDVIALHAAGFENAVATLGTAITSEQARIFAKYTKKVMISYDSDEAGQTAAKKAMRLLSEVGLEVRVLRMNGAKDPDEYIKKFGRDRFRNVLKDSQSGFHFQLDAVMARHDAGTPEDKIRAADEVSAIIAEYRTPVERDVYAGEAAKVLEIDAAVLRNNVALLVRKKINESRREEEREAVSAIRNLGDRVNPQAAVHPTEVTAEESILGFLLLFEEYRSQVTSGAVDLQASEFVTELNKRIFEEIIRQTSDSGGFSYSSMGQTFSVDEMARMERMMQERQALSHTPDIFLSCVNRLKESNTAREKKGSGDINQNLDFLRERAKNRKKQ